MDLMPQATTITPIYTAENQAGDIIIIHAEATFTRESFTTYVMSAMRDMDGNDPNAQRLDLYEWDGHETFARWLMGSECVPFVSWPRMAEDACFGRIEHVWPGRLMFLRPNEKPPQPSTSLRNLIDTVSGDGYDRSDPKHPQWRSVHADIWDNREKGA